MSRLAAIFAGLCLLVPAAGLAQQPFDMTPELYLRETPEDLPEIPVPAAPAPTPSHTDRYLLPGTGIRFEGEIGRRLFQFYLTEEQAAAPASLNLAMLNAVFVSPEDSRLSIAINGTELATTPIESPATVSSSTLPVPEGLLVPGRNSIAFGATQRHRTDCSVASTYELWSELYSPGTFLRFTGADLGVVSSLADLAAIGLQENGATGLYLLVPQWQESAAATAALRLVQELALAIKSPEIAVTLIDSLEERNQTGALTVVLATADQLPALDAGLQAQAGAGPLAGFASGASRPNTLVVSGPDWTAIETAVRSVGARNVPPENDLSGLRVDLATSVPLITGRSEMSLASLGVETAEFNGRRYHAAFRFALPADFYASAYAEAELILDAAYSAAVLPGSELDIYVNGRMAASVPILRTEGGAFRNSRLRIPMTNFRAGINEIHVETVLLTREDELCPPGLSGRAAERFLFSSNSRIAFPDFARLAEYPDLRALAGTGFPYAGTENLPVAIGGDRAALEAAMMLLARVALEAGAVLPATAVPMTALDPAANALVVAPMGQMPPGLLTRIRIVELEPNGAIPAVGTIEDALERWRNAAEPGAGNLTDRISEWVTTQFNLQPENFWLFRRDDGAYLPQSEEAVILSQAPQDEGGIWTMLTIPQASALVPATRTLTRPDIWAQVGGRVSAVSAGEETVLAVDPLNPVYVQTQPFSFSNLRLILANGLSINVLGYTLLLAAGAILLSAATLFLLSSAGRRRP